MTDAERDAFLNEPGVLLKIGTVSPEGRPLVAPIWFIREGDRICFTARQRSEWLAHLRANPSVALCIDEQPYPYRKLLVQGRAEIVHDVGRDDEWRDLYRQIARRYVSPEDADAYVEETIDQPRALLDVSLSGSRVRSWRMPLEGESYKGIWADRYYTLDAKIRRHEAGGRLPDVIGSESDD
jgi:nitroimidazol reductase NimA-like FMN-containing flavoprotein (pyridoxamine 5'-phosphate oxidase superfamily)